MEARRRAEADKNLQAQLNAELKAMYERVSAQSRETQKSLKTSVDALSRSFSELNSGLREEREQRSVQMEQLTQRLMLKVKPHSLVLALRNSASTLSTGTAF